ncbi:hypothetical protein BG844_08885 [Couchioplanes caeruleus subsp. caeruleus]|uniref:Uncharacterized protein n=2 Tax=Couchioplanes caeruleus TaxID=56438 RepID=A0A1K0GTJ1_9ACTN|nr:hypothetical protein BG844_08885 [Couchioplanes caeruleus subsp. caeruleus]
MASLGATATMVAVGLLATPQAASAVTYVPVDGASFSGPAASADCQAYGKDGRSRGKWDFYRCTSMQTYVHMIGYVYV